MRSLGVTADDINAASVDEALDVMETGGVSQAKTQQASATIEELQAAGKLSASQAERYNALVESGLKPTRAQVTREPSDFQAQQEAAKTSSQVRTALEEQEAALTGAFDTRISGIKGELDTTGSAITDTIRGKAVALDQEIGDIYRAVEETLPNQPIVSLRSFAGTLKRLQPENRLTNGFVGAVRGFAKDQGINLKNPKAITVKDAEKIRKYINQLYGAGLNNQGVKASRQLKAAIDSDVTRAGGEDFYKAARKANENFHQGLAKNARDKFDTNQNSLVRDILENQIKPDDVFNQVVLSNRWKADDLIDLKRYLFSGTKEQAKTGVQSWNTLRKDLLDYIKQQAFTGPADQAGFQAMSRASLERVLKRIGRKKLETIFTKPELKFIDDIMKVAKLREPVRGTALGKGPSAQAISALEDAVKKFPPLRFMLEGVMERAEAQQITSPARAIQSQMQQARTMTSPPSMGRVGARTSGAILGEQITGEQ